MCLCFTCTVSIECRFSHLLKFTFQLIILPLQIHNNRVQELNLSETHQFINKTLYMKDESALNSALELGYTRKKSKGKTKLNSTFLLPEF